ncbi:MAG: hypothetical protein ACUVRL_04480 [Candidatus Saccharicenans sp.]|uniref:hypothetical protein n=1 Tax=Candidatus Saccharicenans sp. TaxID=2819258 RepID=UPI0040491388
MAGKTKFILKAIFNPWKHLELYEAYRTSRVGSRVFFLLTGLALAFSLTSFVQAACGHFPAVPIILPLGLENYFFWQALLLVPWVLASWLMVSLVFRVILKLLAKNQVSFRPVLVGYGMSFSVFLFWLWLPHLLTAVLYLLGMSQKEWVDLLSHPGWFQTLYLIFLALALAGGWLALTLSLVKKKWVKNWASILVASLSYLLWLALVFVLLR